jgi:RNA polymerase sigma-70 factor (ECF subfamily)
VEALDDLAPSIAATGLEGGRSWLRRFREGDRATLADLYRRYGSAVTRSIEAFPIAIDRDAITQEIFCRLVADDALRCSYRGGDMGAWLRAMARSHSIDCLRRRRRERSWEAESAMPLETDGPEVEVEARLLVERFCAEVLPKKWVPLFVARFVRQLTQTEAAASLGIARTTLAYQESKVRRLLRGFLRRGGKGGAVGRRPRIDVHL